MVEELFKKITGTIQIETSTGGFNFCIVGMRPPQDLGLMSAYVKELVDKGMPFKSKTDDKSAKIIADLESQLADAKAKIEALSVIEKPKAEKKIKEPKAY